LRCALAECINGQFKRVYQVDLKSDLDVDELNYYKEKLAVMGVVLRKLKKNNKKGSFTEKQETEFKKI